MKKPDILIASMFRTTNSYSSVSLSLGKALSQHSRVFYINHPYSIKDIWTGRRSAYWQQHRADFWRHRPFLEGHTEGGGFAAYTPPVTLPINALPDGALYRRLHQWNQQQMERTVAHIKKQHQVKDFIYINCFDPFFLPVLPKKWGAKCSIYQSIDDISTEPYVAKHGVRLEQQAARDSDLVLVTSTNLHRLFQPLNPNTHILPNAVDGHLFKDLYHRAVPKPAEIAHITQKIIGFVGNLDPVRTDYPLLRQIALAHPDKILLLVGPINSPEVAQLGLDKMPNVLLTGAKPLADVPAYLKYMDVAILPSLLNKMSKSVYPLKINEYLAAGKSVIATSFSDDIRQFQPHIRIADSHRHFIEQIDAAVDDYTPEKVAARAAVAAENTWDKRVEAFWQIVEPYI